MTHCVDVLTGDAKRCDDELTANDTPKQTNETYEGLIRAHSHFLRFVDSISFESYMEKYCHQSEGAALTRTDSNTDDDDDEKEDGDTKQRSALIDALSNALTSPDVAELISRKLLENLNIHK